MLKIRLQRVGRKNDPSFRVVVTDSRRGPKSADYVELLGSYNPRQKTRSFKTERIQHWIAMGAQISGTMTNLLINEKIITGKKVNVLGKKTPIVKEPTEEELKKEADAKDKAESTDEAVDNSQKESAPADSAEAEVKEETPKEEEKKKEEPKEEKSPDSKAVEDKEEDKKEA